MQHPNGYQPSPGGGAPTFPPPPPQTQPLLPPGWEQAADPTSGRSYYANRSTGETSWVPPPYFPPPPPPPAVQQQLPPPPLQMMQQPSQPLYIGQPIMVGGAQPPIMQPAAGPPVVNNLSGGNGSVGMPTQSSYLQQYTPMQSQVGLNPDPLATANQPVPMNLQPETQTTTINNISGFGASTATTPGLLVPSVRAMINAEHTKKINGESLPKLELEGLSTGAIADLCNVSRELKAKNVDGGDFAEDSANLADGKKQSEAEDEVDQYYSPIQPFSLPVSSMAPHIEPGRLDIRLHALHSKLGKI